MGGVSRGAILGSIVAIVAFATAAVMFTVGDATMERLALLFALIGTVVPALISALRSDQAATNTNGTLSAVTAQSEAFRAELPVHVQTAVIAALAAKHDPGAPPV